MPQLGPLINGFPGNNDQNAITHSNRRNVLSLLLFFSLYAKIFTHKCIQGTVALDFKGLKPWEWRGKFLLNRRLGVFKFFRAPSLPTLGKDATVNSMKCIWIFPQCGLNKTFCPWHRQQRGFHGCLFHLRVFIANCWPINY